MKKLFLSLISAGLLALPLFVLAQTGLKATAVTVPDLTVEQTLNVLDRIADWLFTILLIIAVIFILIAAYSFVTATGSPDKVRTARELIMWALIGILVAFLARGLVNLVERVVLQG